MKRLMLALWLLCPLVLAQDVVITAPSKVNRGSFAMVTVMGLKPDELAKAQVGIIPSDPKILTIRMPTADSTAVYFLAVFEDAAPGQRTFRVSLNPWRAHLDAAAADVIGIDEKDAKRLRDLATEFQKYPLRLSSATLEVGTGPFPPPDPPKPPVPPIDGIASQMIILRDQTATTTKIVSLLLDLQEKYQRGTKPEMFLLDKTDPSALTKQYLARKPVAAAFPYYFLIEQGGRILAHGELPGTLQQTTDIIAKYQEKK